MADEEQLRLLKQGVKAWDDWRKRAPDTRVDLRKANLSGTNLGKVDLSEADLSGANLREAGLGWANLRAADLSRADLSRADLSGADLIGSNLSGADLSGADLGGADLTRANLREANLWKANLSVVNLSRADLSGANLSGADLIGSNLSGACLIGSNLSRANLRKADLSVAELNLADLSRVNLRMANLSMADLSTANLREVDLGSGNLNRAILNETIVSNVDLSSCINLDSIRHQGPSIVDIRTLQRSGRLPLVFLRGIGLPDALIEYLPSLLSQAIQHYSCFISYSSKDDEFVHRLHADLQDKGVRCWFAPEDMKIGAKILDTLDQAIRLGDKVLLVLSESSIASDWVEDEVTKAFAEESQRGGTVLFPVRVDEAVFATEEAWALKLRDNRNIGDFRAWKDHDRYQESFERLLRDLKA